MLAAGMPKRMALLDGKGVCEVTIAPDRLEEGVEPTFTVCRLIVPRVYLHYKAHEWKSVVTQLGAHRIPLGYMNAVGAAIRHRRYLPDEVRREYYTFRRKSER